MTAAKNALELLGKATEAPFCLFLLSLALLADAWLGFMGLAFSAESLALISLPRWFRIVGSTLVFYSLGSRVLQWATRNALITMGAHRWINRFLDSPERRAAAARDAQNRINPDRLLMFSLLHDNKVAKALVEQHQSATREEERTERVHQHYAFCFLLTLLLDAFGQGPFAQTTWTQLRSSGFFVQLAALALFVGLVFAAVYLGVIRALTWSSSTMLRLPGHEQLELPDVTPPQPGNAWPHLRGGEGGPIPQAKDQRAHKHAA